MELQLAEKSYKQLHAERMEVRKRYPTITFPDPILEPVWFGRRDKTLIEGTKAIVDRSTGKTMNICSDQYKLVHYEDVIQMIEDVTSRITSFGKIALCPTMLSDGGKMKLTMKFPEAQHLISKKEAIVPKIDVFTSYDLSYKLMGKFGAFVLRCTNGMGTWQKFKQFARKHLQTLILSDFQFTITEGLDLFGLQVDEWKKWNTKVIDLEMYKGVWEMLPFSEKEKEKIEILPETSTALTIKDALPQKALTLWGLNSILTQYATHEIKSDIRKIDVEPMISRAMEITYGKAA